MKYKNLNLKYALINVWYFMLVCGAIGYANNFLQSKGFETGIIGIILTLVSIVSLIGQTSMAPVIDKSKTWNEKRYIMFTLFVSVIMYVLMLFLPAGNFLIVICAVIGFACATIGMPYLNSIAFIYEKEGQKINYGLCRGVGSASYAVAGLIIGWLMKFMDASILPIWTLIMAVLCLFTVSTLPLPQENEEVEETDTADEKTKVSYGAFFSKYRDIMMIVCALILLFFCHMLVNNYMINVIEAIGGDSGSQGTAVFIQAMVELPPMFAFAWILKKIKVDNLMLYAAVFFSLKHLLILIAPNMTVFYIAMILQMVSYALITPSMVYFADSHIAPEDRNQGQVIMTATSTIGGLFASFLGGMLFQATDVHTTLLIGTIASIAGTILMVTGCLKLRKK